MEQKLDMAFFPTFLDSVPVGSIIVSEHFDGTKGIPLATTSIVSLERFMTSSVHNLQGQDAYILLNL